ELLGEQRAEARFSIVRDLAVTFSVEIPIAKLGRHSKDRALLQLPVELVLKPAGIEASQHRFERKTHRGRERALMIAHVAKSILECFGRLEIGGVALDEQVVEGIVDVG